MFITHKLYKTCSFVQVLVNDTRVIHQAKNIKSMQATECISESCLLQRREREGGKESESLLQGRLPVSGRGQNQWAEPESRAS